MTQATTDNAPMAEDSALKLETIQPTFFKSEPVNSSSLNEDEKSWVRQGSTFTVLAYDRADGHVRVELDEGDTGYFYEGHVRLLRGDRSPRVSPRRFTRAAAGFHANVGDARDLHQSQADGFLYACRQSEGSPV